jgi:hypothetical protein
MDALSRRRIEMGTRALDFSRAHPDADAGYLAATAKLEQLVARAGEAAAAQRNGIVDARAASARKNQLRRTMLSVHIPHLAQVGQEAATEDHELGKVFKFSPAAGTFLAFRTAARTMAAEAEARREVLIRHGLAPSVLDELGRLLDEFDGAVTLGSNGRALHMGATAELAAVGAGILRTVRVMDGRNRQRFQQDEKLLSTWEGVSAVLGKRRTAGSGTTTAPGEVAPPPGDVRPAA